MVKVLPLPLHTKDDDEDKKREKKIRCVVEREGVRKFLTRVMNSFAKRLTLILYTVYSISSYYNILGFVAKIHKRHSKCPYIYLFVAHIQRAMSFIIVCRYV